MGWSSGVNSEGEAVGYAVEAACTSCGKPINRGLAYTCGGLDGHSAVPGTCGRAFCEEHLFYGSDHTHEAVCWECLQGSTLPE